MYFCQLFFLEMVSSAAAAPAVAPLMMLCCSCCWSTMILSYSCWWSVDYACRRCCSAFDGLPLMMLMMILAEVDSSVVSSSNRYIGCLMLSSWLCFYTCHFDTFDGTWRWGPNIQIILLRDRSPILLGSQNIMKMGMEVANSVHKKVWIPHFLSLIGPQLF